MIEDPISAARPSMDLASELGVSTVEWCTTQPKQRHTYRAQGLLLYFPRTGLVMVPYLQHKGGWACVVVIGNETYPPNGYTLSVPDCEITTAIEIPMVDLLQIQFRCCGSPDLCGMPCVEGPISGAMYDLSKSLSAAARKVAEQEDENARD